MVNTSAIITFVLAVIFIISAVLITISSTNLYAFRNLDAFFANAYSDTVWASVISWLLVAAAVAAFFLYLYYYSEVGVEVNALQALQKPSDAVSGWSIFFLILLLALVFFVGVLSALTATNIKKSDKYNSMNAQMHTAYDDAVVAAILSLVAGSIVIIWFLVDVFYYFYPTPVVVKEEIKPITNDKVIELKEIKKAVATS